MADVATTAHSYNTTELNGSVVVNAPKGAGSRGAQGAGFDPASSGTIHTNYVLRAGDGTDLGTGGVAKGAVGGHNDSINVADMETKWTNRFDDPRYYNGDNS